MASRGAPPRPRSMSALRFILAFGVVSALGDILYEGARSIHGPLLASLGATALVVSVVTGAGEAIALALRLLFGRLADARRRRWSLAIAGYAVTVVTVPLLGLATTLTAACGLILGERAGKAVRSPSKDAMLAQAGSVGGRGWAFAIHEAMDQCGALLGPLFIAAMVAITGGFSTGLILLVVPGIALMAILLWLRSRVPDPGRYEPDDAAASPDAVKAPLPRLFWAYAAFSAITMLGFATFGLLAFHLADLVTAPWIPVVYALAMATDAVAALGFGRLYDRIGLPALVILPVLAAIVPWLAFGTTVTMVVIGIALWGAALGIQESAMRAAVGDLVPDARRGSAYGIFAAATGVAWLLGSIVIGVLYERDLPAGPATGPMTTPWSMVLVITAIQGLALTLLLVVHRSRQGARTHDLSRTTSA